ncbi:efflux RND transporter permease subunit [candidate division KSB1 bacterium]
MSLIRFVIRRKTLISMLFIGLSMLGYLSYQQLPMELMPNVEYPYLIVQVSGSGEMDPEYIEETAVIPVEGVVATMEKVNSIETSINRRRGTIYVYFDQGVNIEYTYLKLQEKLAGLSSDVTDEFSVNVNKVDTERLSNTFMRLQVRGSGGLERVRAVIDKSISDDLENIEGVATVEVVGGQEKVLEIKLSNEAVESFGITPSEVSSMIRRNNYERTFVGYAHEKDKHYFVNVVSDYKNVTDIENVVVDPDGPVFLKDVAEIYFGVKEQTSISRVNGMDAVTIQLVRDANTNLIDLSHVTRDVIDRLNRELKYQDVEIVIQTDEAETMEENMNIIMWLALTGGFLAVVILWFFLRNLRLVLTVLLSIPVSLLIAFNFFYAFDITLNSLTLIGIVLAIGMLLDNSIVVLENIYRKISSKQSKEESVIEGVAEVWRSITAATLTTITVFIPFLFASDHLVKMVGYNIGVSIISTLFVSLIAALLLIPMLSHSLIDRAKGKMKHTFNIVSRNNRIIQVYTLLLKSAIRSPVGIISAVVLLFFISIALCLSLSMDVPSEVELKQFDIYATMPGGSTLENSDRIVSQIESEITNIEEIKERVSTIYEEEANITVILKDDFKELNGMTVSEIRDMIEERYDNFSAAEVSLSEPSSSARFGQGMGRNSTASLERMFGIGTQQEKIVLKGNDFELLKKVAADIEYYMEEFETISSVSANVSESQPEIHLLLDNRVLNINNITLNSISTELNTFQTEVSSGANMKFGTEEYEINIKNESLEEERSFDDLKRLRIPDQSEGEHELEQLGDLIYSYGLTGVNRLDQSKQIEITYTFEQDINESRELLEASRQEISDLIMSLNIPAGISAEIVLDESQFDEFYFLIGLAFLLIFMILASVFESITAPVVMMFTIPLATIGSLWALIFTGNSLFNVNSLLGFLILLGVVVNNGIIFIDYTNLLRRKGYNRFRALLTAGKNRIRPIMITAITTVVAMIPLAMGESEYVSQIGASFAITVIGGLSIGTIFTLVFIPTVYSGLESFLLWFRKLDIKIKLIQAAVTLISGSLIYIYTDDVIWQFAYFCILLISIPGFTWFIQGSLRHAKEDYISRKEALYINIRRMVKIYGAKSRFRREWDKGSRISENLKKHGGMLLKQKFDQLTWQIPLLGFLVYFVYFYIESPVWLFFMTFPVYFFILIIIGPAIKQLESKSEVYNSKLYNWLGSSLSLIVLCGFPAISLYVYHHNDFSRPVLSLVGTLWYLTIILYMLSTKFAYLKIEDLDKKSRIYQFIYRFFSKAPLLSTKDITFHALKGVTIDIKSGMFGLIGPNGAGKTTLMRIICGILEESRGTIRINDINLREKREELQGLIGYLPQEFGCYENMTAYEFLDYIAILKNVSDSKQRKQIIDYALNAVHLGEFKHNKIGSFSGGMKQRVGIAMTLLHLPRILVVDEPTAGLDPKERIKFRNLLVELSRDRIVIFSTHIIEDISSSCNKVAVLDKGELYYTGDPQNMSDSAVGKVWQFYADQDVFDSLQEKLWIVHHSKSADKIRIRCLADGEPYPGSERVTPTLEDAYLWMLGKENENVRLQKSV